MPSFEEKLFKVSKRGERRCVLVSQVIKIQFAAYFGPAWDGFQLRKPPPTRKELLRWGKDESGEGELYDYGDDFDVIPQWQV